MAKGFKHGGGITLNIRIVGGTAKPAAPLENTIWVNTSENITGWIFSNKEPSEAAEGVVWFRTTAAMACASQFNALRRNTIEVYPTQCSQYLGGAWVSKGAETFKNGAWTAWSFWAFKSGEGLHPTLTGFTNASCDSEKVYNKSLFSSSTEPKRPIKANEKLDVTQYGTAHFDGVSVSVDGNGNANSSSFMLFVGEKESEVGSSKSSGEVIYCEEKDFSFDISSVTGEVEYGAYIICATGSIEFTFSIKNIWFE